MKKYYLHTTIVICVLVALCGCSLKKNTAYSRNYQAVNTRFNVYFNGQVNYDEGMKMIFDANKDNFSAVIPMYPISKHENARAATGKMDVSIEKSRKAIKLRSIKQKPVRNSKKWKDEKYKHWYEQEEFNPEMWKAWIMLGQSEFHKADFLGSVGTFTYIANHYSTNSDVVNLSRMWMVRAYAEMDWIYEAEQMLSNIKQDNISRRQSGMYAAVNADLLLKKKQYVEAIPFLEIALKHEKDRRLRQRFNFLLAQLYTQTGDKTKAYQCYSTLIKMNPAYEMDFNARIYRAELGTKKIEAVRKDLKRMLKNSNNKDYLDKIYFTLGKTYLQTNDTAKAIENFNLSIEKSTLAGYDKALTLITLGDLYYNTRRYAQAQPCYDQASKILTVTDDNYFLVQKRAETLGELVVEQEIVMLQDSLQILADLSPEEQLAIVNQHIKDLIAAEAAAAKAAEEEAEIRALTDLNSGESSNSLTPNFDRPAATVGAGANANWYFYNANLMSSGKRDFVKKWGSRKLEDNWRRTSKSSPLFANDDNAENPTPESAETLADSTVQTPVATDSKDPQFYLQQIPKTAAEREQSNKLIADALYAMGGIYKEKIEDIPMAIETFEEFARRFPDDPRRVDAYYHSYIAASKVGDSIRADNFRQQILSDFPTSRYADALSHPDFFERMKRMYQQQDSLYNDTYQAYLKSNFEKVKTSAAEFENNYPLSVLLPKFQFLNALSIGKTDSAAVFKTTLDDLITKYPTSDVSAMAKDILALMNQGLESQRGSSGGTLLALRSAQDSVMLAEDETFRLTADKDQKYRLMLLAKADEAVVNKLLFNIASFNFTRFIIKDFDLLVTKSDSLNRTLFVSNFDNYSEVLWYNSSIKNDTSIYNLVERYEIELLPVSEHNFALIGNIFSLDDYRKFYAENIKTADSKKATQTIALPETMAMREDTVVANKEVKDNKEVTEVKDNKEVREVKEVKDNKDNKEVREVKDNKEVTGNNAPASVQTPAPEPNAPLYKNLFAITPNAPHFVAIVVLSGDFSFDNFNTALKTYNTDNYSMLNLNANLEKVGNQQIIIIGSFADSNSAKSYLQRIVKERAVFAALSKANYRNLLGTQNNLNIMMQKNEMNTYFDFMREYYLK
ncbi:MAG: hypothetical protein LBV75_06240 [Paludibacter sp.]|nr:hypothetical protein [Paludibacter sp.]